MLFTTNGWSAENSNAFPVSPSYNAESISTLLLSRKWDHKETFEEVSTWFQINRSDRRSENARSQRGCCDNWTADDRDPSPPKFESGGKVHGASELPSFTTATGEVKPSLELLQGEPNSTLRDLRNPS